jgi:hypothetical protein
MTADERKRRAKAMRAWRRFSRYARLGARAVGIEPKLIRVAFDHRVE